MTTPTLLITTLGILLATPPATTSYGQRAEDYKTITTDGAWCWFSDPRAVYYEKENRCSYIGFVTSKGDVVVSVYNHQNNTTQSQVIYEKLQADDHVSPSLLFLPDGRLMVFFTRHNGTVFYTTSKKPEDISAFEPVASLELGSRLCYTNPVLLQEENNRIYLFFRGGENWKPTFITSDDLGRTWSKPRAFVAKLKNNIYNRPYTKIVSDGKASIHMAFTDGHPREENHNSIYYLKYEKGHFYDAAGNIMGSLEQLPIQQELVPKAYDGVANNQRAWIWDISVNNQNCPVVVFTTHPEETQHFYYYAVWNGSEWQHKKLCAAGSAFPRFERKKHERDPEPHYSGGIVLDHADPNIVYLSRPHNDRFEIEKWVTTDGGRSLKSVPVPARSLKDNVRPYVLRNAPSTLSRRLFWMHIDHYAHYTKYRTSIKGNQPAERFSSAFSDEAIRTVMTAVADWQIDHFDLARHHPLDWTNGALYTGMIEWAKISSDKKYMNWLNQLGRKYDWQPFYRMYHADDIVVSQMYLEMYKLKKNHPDSYRILGPTLSRLDYVLAHPSQGSLILNYNDAKTLERWSWCDALFMAPPVYAKLSNITGDEKYMAFMNSEFKATYDYLYDSEEHLFFRDRNYFPDVKREANGAKVFWGRGNGWVMGGLVLILKELPADSTFKPFYEKLFREMAHKVARCQNEDGFWHASMLDPESYPNPETSSSAFFCYALAYGINAGLIDRDTFIPVVTSSWRALVSTVFPDGKLGWVQPIGENPKNVTAEMTEVYGTGAFLLAGTEVLKLVN